MSINPPWERQSSERKQGTRSSKLFFLYCEGETEFNYFSAFTKDNSRVKCIDCIKGKTPGFLIKRAIKEIKDCTIVPYLNEKKPKQNDEVWCIFDRDDHEDIDEAFTNYKKYNNKAGKNKLSKIRIAYTHEAFEYWCLLHFDYHQSAIGRKILNNKIGIKLGAPHYGSSSKGDPELYQKIINNGGTIENALKFGLKIYNHHGYVEKSEIDYTGKELRYDDSPNTTVHFLIEAINNANSDNS